VPGLPFLGNWLTVFSYVPNASGSTNGIPNATAAYEVALRRQSDCSLDEDFTLPGSASPSATYIGSLPSAQDYFHELAGLTTKPDVFPYGCGYQELGLPPSPNVLLLGNTADGAAITAELNNNGNLLASVTDLVANTVTTTTLNSTPNGLSFSAGDLRGNGITDIVEVLLADPATSKPAAVVFLGNGDGTFKPPVYYDVGGNLTVTDVTGDGIPDIVVAGTGTVTTLIGKGDGTFTLGPVSAVTSTAFSGSPVTGDFNGDGKKDLLLGGTVLFGAGNGSFTQGPTNAALLSATPVIGDLRNNGKFDAVVSERGFVAIFYGNGDGTFTTGPRYAALPDYEQVTITDIDGDGNPDIVLGTSTGGVFIDGDTDTNPPMFQILMGRGDGTFVDSLVYNQGFYDVGPQITSADFTGDGKLDVLVVDPNNSGTTAPSQLVVLPGDGKGNLGTAIASPINFVPQVVVEADMNGDGKPDAVVGGSGPMLAVLINQGNGTFAGEQDYSLSISPVSLAVGDFNGDGRMDVAVGGAGVYVLFGQANGKLGSPVQIDSSLDASGLVAGSLTTDGRTDLVVADQGAPAQGVSSSVNGALHVYLGNANGTFTTVTAPTTSATNYTVAALGDLNHDGKLDLIVAGFVVATSTTASIPNVYTLLGNGDGTFQAAVTLSLSGTDEIGANSIALADFNKDGKLDVAVGNPVDYTEVLLGNGDGTLTDTILALGQRPVTVAAADLLGNGFPELLVGQANGNLAVFLNTNPWISTATTTTALTSTASTITPGGSITFTATITPPTGSTATPTGSVTFLDGTATLGTGTISSGVASLTNTTLGNGANSITAVYSGDANYSGSTSVAVSVTVTAAVPVSVPNVVGLTQAAASTAITGVGLTVGTVATATSNTVASGSVISQSPIAGASAASGSPVNLVVSTGPAAVSVPNVVGLTQAAASTAITGAGLTVGTVTTATSNTVASGSVISQSPLAGTAAASGSAVNLVVSTGPAVPTGFTLAANPGSLSFAAAATTGNTSAITVTQVGTFTGSVTLSCAVTGPIGATSPATCSMSSVTPVTVPGGTTNTVAVTTTATTTPGAYVVTVTGTSGTTTATAVVNVTVTAPANNGTFALTNTTGGSITIASPGQSGTSTISITPSGGFTGNVTLTASVTSSPAGATDLPALSFGSTSPVSISSATIGTATLTVSTTAPTVGALAYPERLGVRWYPAGGAALACVLLLGIPARRRRLRTMLSLLVFLGILTGGAVGCGGSGSGNSESTGSPGTTTGNYTVTVTATSGTTSAQTTVSVTVN
jgi:beta-lactam-binding protein with PASTA domain